MTNDGNAYSNSEKELLNWIAFKTNDVSEMTKIAPVIADVMGRTESAIRKQIEDRKRDAGHKEFFWART